MVVILGITNYIMDYGDVSYKEFFVYFQLQDRLKPYVYSIVPGREEQIGIQSYIVAPYAPS